MAFIDADCMIDRNCFEEFMNAFALHPEAAGCGGIQIIPQDASVFQHDVYSFMARVGFLTDYVRERSREAGSGKRKVESRYALSVQEVRKSRSQDEVKKFSMCRITLPALLFTEKIYFCRPADFWKDYGPERIVNSITGLHIPEKDLFAQPGL